MSIIRDMRPDENGLGWLYGKFDSESIFKGEMKMTIYSDTEESIAYAEKCIAHYNRLTENPALLDKIRENLKKFMYYMRDEWEAMGIYEEIAEDTDKAVKGCEAGEDIIKSLTNPCLSIELPEDDTDEIGYNIESDCPWEPEHQCSIIIRNDTLKYVGPCERNTPWDDDDEYYCIWLDEEEE